MENIKRTKILRIFKFFILCSLEACMRRKGDEKGWIDGVGWIDRVGWIDGVG